MLFTEERQCWNERTCAVRRETTAERVISKEADDTSRPSEIQTAHYKSTKCTCGLQTSAARKRKMAANTTLALLDKKVHLSLMLPVDTL